MGIKESIKTPKIGERIKMTKPCRNSFLQVWTVLTVHTPINHLHVLQAYCDAHYGQALDDTKYKFSVVIILN